MEQDRSEALASVTIDSSLIYPTTSRRFLMALWEMEGLKVELLPRTIQEMYGFVQDSERSYWRRALAREARRAGRTWPPETVEASVGCFSYPHPDRSVRFYPLSTVSQATISQPWNTMAKPT